MQSCHEEIAETCSGQASGVIIDAYSLVWSVWKARLLLCPGPAYSVRKSVETERSRCGPEA